MKMFIIPIIIATLVAIPTFVGVIPVAIGAGALLALIVTTNLLVWAFARGLPIEIMNVRMRGGMLWGVIKHTGQLLIKRFQPTAGMVRTERHGTFNIEPEGLLNVDGIPLGLAPEDVGYNIRATDAQLKEKLKELNITDISEVCDIDQFGYVTGFKDRPDLGFNADKLKIDLKPKQLNFRDFEKYVTKAANPHGIDANIEIGIQQGQRKEITRLMVILFAGFAVLLACIGLWLLIGSRGGEQIIRVVTDNAAPVIIPA